MLEVPVSCKLVPWTWLTLLTIILTTKSTATSIAKPGCPTQCGSLTVPYPFGIGLDGACSMGEGYNINCNISFNPPKAFLGERNIEIIDISLADAKARAKMYMASKCYKNGTLQPDTAFRGRINLKNKPLVFSDTANKFIVIGCDDVGFIRGKYGDNNFTGGVISFCYRPEDVNNGSCSGSGCSQTSIPKGLKRYKVSLTSIYNHTNVSDFNSCGYAFLGEYSKYAFNFSDLSDPGFRERTKQNVPVVLEWTVGGNQTCDEAKKNAIFYACKGNTTCTDYNVSTEGYRCSCREGYEGNPYLGCTDINECWGPSNPCSHTCSNELGNRTCSCPKGYHGDGLTKGSGCALKLSILATSLSLGLILVLLLSFMLTAWIYSMVKRHKLMKQRETFFEQNGGMLLKQQMSLQRNNNTRQESCTRIFSPEELRLATNNYSKDRFLGEGGYGTVYKGVLEDGREVAIKKSKVANQTQIEQFINEVMILTQINHRNVVKLIGCCLETEMPQLVYEYISHGTLYEHIHTKNGSSWLTWANCVRVASEAADAFAYLHSEASIPIIHRDIKSANILLDENYTTKIADFGASRLIPIGQNELATLVQGTIGYLDPEYLQRGQLTDKSDVYSFGVVLTELLTKNKPTSPDRNLSSYFLSAMKENRLLGIVDFQFFQQADQEQVYTMGRLVKRCLSVIGDDRPTMKEVATELEGMKRQIKHLLGEQNYQQTDNLGNKSSILSIDSYDGYNPSSTDEFSEQFNQKIDVAKLLDNPR